MKRIILLALISLIALSPNAYGEIELRAKQMRTTDGLPSNSIRNIYQDSKGFLWLGTLNGLSRYDGNSFLNFQPEINANGRISLIDNRINRVIEDQNGFLWIGTGPELYSCYDLQKSRFVDFTGSGEYEQNYAYSLFASNGDIWLYHKTNGARHIITKSDRTMTSVEFKTERGNLPDNRVQFIEEDEAGRIWIGTMRGLAFISKGDFNIIDRKNNFIASITHKRDVFFLTDDGYVYWYNTTSGKLSKSAELPAGEIRSNCKFAFKNQWIIFTSTGTYNYDFNSHKVTSDPKLNIKEGIVLNDNRGNYWVFNHTGKIYYILSETGETKEL